MPDLFFKIAFAVLALAVAAGIYLMGRVQTARYGNRLSALSALLAILITLWREQLVQPLPLLLCLLAGLLAGLLAAWKIRMIAMPQFVALLNGLGGAASALVALSVLPLIPGHAGFSSVVAILALAIGALTFSGSLVAAGKLQLIIPQKPLVLPGHSSLVFLHVFMIAASGVWLLAGLPGRTPGLVLLIVLGGSLGLISTLRIGGADMPITIALLNALSGVAGSVAGMAIGNRFLVFAGAVIGASGLLLTRCMCQAMNRSLAGILAGRTSAAASRNRTHSVFPPETGADGFAAAEPGREEAEQESAADRRDNPAEAKEPAGTLADPYQVAAAKLRAADRVIIVPGYGMALAQAQQLVHDLADRLEAQGKAVKYAIHPVAGRMPGHMNVLLAEADVPYDQLFELDAINPEFASCDVVLIVGANDVVNPAASTAVDTPIYGMPVLAVEQAKHLVICNFDLKPGYAGVANPLYERKSGVSLLTGDAADTLQQLIRVFAG